MSNTNRDQLPNFNPDDRQEQLAMPPLGPTAIVPEAQRDDMILARQLNEKFHGPSARVPVEHQDSRLRPKNKHVVGKVLFGGTALAVAGVGTFMLVGGSGEESPGQEAVATLALPPAQQPEISPTTALSQATTIAPVVNQLPSTTLSQEVAVAPVVTQMPSTTLSLETALPVDLEELQDLACNGPDVTFPDWFCARNVVQGGAGDVAGFQRIVDDITANINFAIEADSDVHLANSFGLDASNLQLDLIARQDQIARAHAVNPDVHHEVAFEVLELVGRERNANQVGEAATLLVQPYETSSLTGRQNQPLGEPITMVVEKAVVYGTGVDEGPNGNPVMVSPEFVSWVIDSAS